MPEPLKNLYNEAFVDTLSIDLSTRYKLFNVAAFKKDIFDMSWPEKELKERMRHLATMLGRHLPSVYEQALAVVKPVAEKYRGVEALIFPDFVEVHGLDNYETSVDALAFFTPFSSSELAVRPFIVRYGEKMMTQMSLWAESDNHHVRRLASEGCRPRLPWAMSLPEFKKNPDPVIKILEKLKRDPSEYVRRSVANNLNDISKDHPELLLKIAKQWQGENPETDWIIKHACRSLLKSGEPRALALFGFRKPAHISLNQLKVGKTVKWGEALEFSFEIESSKKKLGKLRIEYAIDFMKSNGKQARKVFKISESDYGEHIKSVSRTYSFRKISTRKYYSGDHSLAIIINGHEFSSRKFRLTDG